MAKHTRVIDLPEELDAGLRRVAADLELPVTAVMRAMFRAGIRAHDRRMHERAVYDAAPDVAHLPLPAGVAPEQPEGWAG